MLSTAAAPVSVQTERQREDAEAAKLAAEAREAVENEEAAMEGTMAGLNLSSDAPVSAEAMAVLKKVRDSEAHVSFANTPEDLLKIPLAKGSGRLSIVIDAPTSALSVSPKLIQLTLVLAQRAINANVQVRYLANVRNRFNLLHQAQLKLQDSGFALARLRVCLRLALHLAWRPFVALGPSRASVARLMPFVAFGPFGLSSA